MSLETAMASQLTEQAVSDASPTESASNSSAQQVGDSQKTQDTPQETPKETASSILSRLAREKKERLMLSKQMQERNSEKAQLEARIKELEGKVSQKPKNPIDALMSAGFSYKDATDFVLNDQSMTPEQQIKSVQEEIASLKREQEERETKKREEETKRVEAQYNQVISEFKDEISDFVETNKEKFELTHLYGGQELVYETIAMHYENSLKEWREGGSKGKAPRVLSKEEAAELVERHFEDEIEKLQRVEKVKKKFSPSQQTDIKAPQGSTLRTLSNAATTSPTPAQGRVQDPIARAMAALEKLGK